MRFVFFVVFALIYQARADDEQCQKPLDIVFLIDTSASVATADFEKQREFILDVVQKLNVGPGDEQTRVAAITFSDTITFEFRFRDCENRDCVLEKIKNLQHDQGDATRTYRALLLAHTEAFSQDSGERPDVENVVVVCTDGQTNPGRFYNEDNIKESGKFETWKQAEDVKKVPATVFSIGIGKKVDVEELMGIASEPSDKYVIAVEDYDELNSDNTKELLIKRACGGENIQKEQECKELRADVIFALDTSSSIRTLDNFKKELALVYEFIDQVEIGSTKVQMGLLTFSTDVKMQFHLNEYHTKTELMDAIESKDYQIKGDTYINKAIDMVLKDGHDGFRPETGARTDEKVPAIFVIVTDGKSTRQSSTDKAIKRLKKTSITTFAVGVGDKVNYEELKKIASSSDHVFDVETLDNLVKIRKQLVEGICAKSPSKEEVPQKEEECKETKAEVMVLLDGSSSMRSSVTFDKELKFVVSVIEALPIGSDGVRVGVMQFSDADDINLEIDLNKHSDKQQLAEEVSKIQWQGGNTFLDKALERIRDVMNPDRLRKGIPHIVILLSDGISTDPHQTKIQMQKVRDETDIIFIGIGVGPERDMTEIESLVTQPIGEHAFEVENQDALSSIRKKLLTTVCQSDNRPAAEVCANKEADINFIADLSTSIGHSAVKELKSFMMKLVQNFPIGHDGIQIGLTTFSTKANTEFTLTEYDNVKDIVGAINAVEYTTGDTNTHLAFTEMLQNSGIIADGSRTKVPKIAVLITDGGSKVPIKTLQEANKLKNKGIILFCIGVGIYFDKNELENIASKPIESHVFMVDNYKALENIENVVASKACKSESITNPGSGSGSSPGINNLLPKKSTRTNGWDVNDQMNHLYRSRIDNLGHQLRGVSGDNRYIDDKERNVVDKKNLLSLLRKVLEKENDRRNRF